MRRVAIPVLAALAGGCASATLIDLASRDAGARWLAGHQWVRHESGQAAVIASYDRNWGSVLLFDVTVVNRSDSTLRIEPREFTFALSSTRDEPQQDRFAAADPEAAIADLDQRMAAIESGHANAKMLDAVAGVL